jgi:hypothetical protein
LETIRDSQIKFGSDTAKVCAVSAAESWASFRFSLRRILSPCTHEARAAYAPRVCLFLRSGHGYFSRPVKPGADIVEPVSKERPAVMSILKTPTDKTGLCEIEGALVLVAGEWLGRAAIEPMVSR